MLSTTKKTQCVRRVVERGLLENGEKLTVAQMKGCPSLWMNENARSSGKARVSEVLIDGLSLMALVSDEKIEGLFVSQKNSSVILKVAVKSNGLAVEAPTEDFVSLPGRACVTGLAINSQTEDVCMADSSPSGGIYLVDCRDASFTKLIKNGSPSLKTVLDVSVTSKGNLVFSDVEARRIGRFDSGAANCMVGSGIDSLIH